MGPILRFLSLLTVANGTPVIAKTILGDRLAYPIDGGVRFLDGQPLFGSSKTVRGFVLSVAATALCGSLVGLGARTGVVVASAAMAGDLLSSFVKRRLKLAPSSRASGLDQVPESLLPVLACRNTLAFGPADAMTIVAAFFVGEVLISRLLYRWHVRERPY